MRVCIKVNVGGDRALIGLKPSEYHSKCLAELSVRMAEGRKFHI